MVTWVFVDDTHHLPVLGAEGNIPPMSLSGNRYLFWLIPVLLIAFFVAIVFLAPLEKTLGETIRWVYSHAAFTRAGMMGFYTAGLFGLVVAASNNERLQSWTQTTCVVSLALFIIGGIFSIFAQQRSWGGTMLAEPRMRTSMTVIALAVIVLLLNSWIPWIRLRGLHYAALAAYMAWVIPNTPLVLHPTAAGRTATSIVIRLTFPVLTALALLLGLWVVLFLQRPKAS